jgi:hypothetical protein
VQIPRIRFVWSCLNFTSDRGRRLPADAESRADLRGPALDRAGAHALCGCFRSITAIRRSRVNTFLKPPLFDMFPSDGRITRHPFPQCTLPAPHARLASAAGQALPEGLATLWVPLKGFRHCVSVTLASSFPKFRDASCLLFQCLLFHFLAACAVSVPFSRRARRTVQCE